jgi:predicted dehydrogenase
VTRVGLIGLGLIGAERLTAIRDLAIRFPDESLEVIGAIEPGVPHRSVIDPPTLFDGLPDLIAAEPDLVVVAVPHDVAVEVTTTLLRSGVRVHHEKPLGRSGDEARAITAAAVDPTRLTVGFNYRFLPGVAALLEDVASSWFGEQVSVGMTLGHGGAPGDEDTWKLDPDRAGGGCLIDPGVHFLDLALLLTDQELDVVGGTTWSGHWKTGIEEEAHLLLVSGAGTSVSLDLSVVRWRSTFRIEVHGTEGYGVVTGRNRSYGPQEYRRGRRWGWQSATSQADSEELVVRSDGAETFTDELRSVLGLGAPQSTSVCSADEACRCMDLLDRIRARVGIGQTG